LIRSRAAHSAELIQQYDRLIAAQPGVVRKGATIPYTSVNGHMFSFLSEAGALALRLPAVDREAFLERHGASLHEAHGTVMKEYVTVPEELFGDTAQLLPYFQASFAYAASLKPKPTTRKA
jgi:TfoX/Sxy family transcriptional regulator of competence genes